MEGQEQAPTQEEQEFEAAFTEFSSQDGQTGAAEGVADTAKQPAADDQDNGAGANGSAGNDDAADALDDGDPPVEDTHRAKSWEGRLRKKESDLAAQARSLAERERALAQREEQAKAAAATQAGEAAPGLSDDPDLKEFEEEFPEIAAPVSKLVNRLVSKVGQQAAEAKTAANDVLAMTAREQHAAAIRRAHPDVEEIRGDLDAFISGQPDFIRSSMERVAASGTAEEVIQLLDSYKATKKTTNKTTTAQTGMAVRTRRHSSVSTDALPADDFDAAFKHFSQGK